MSGYVLFSWEPCLSPHKIAFYQAVAADPRVQRVVYVAGADLPPERRAQGWSVADTGGLDVRLSPGRDGAKHLARQAPPEAVHILCGMRGGMIDAVAPILIREKRRFGLFSEPRDDAGVAGRLRRLHSWSTERGIRNHAAFVLAVGGNGPVWFRRTGYPPDRIFPFAYFPPVGNPAPRRAQPGAVPTIAYLGRLEPEKGVDLLIQVQRKLGERARFVFAGSGALAPRLQALAAGEENLDLIGPLDMVSVPDFLLQADIVCAPSIAKDGWGAVVSEALFCGAAVVTTPHVGAAVCLRPDTRLGRVADPTVEAVAAALNRLIDEGDFGLHARARRRDWALRWLSPTAGAEYFLSILDHVVFGTSRPPPFPGRESGR